jgi:hypothetical protein
MEKFYKKGKYDCAKKNLREELMKKSWLVPAVLLIACASLISCAGSGILHGKAKGMAWVDISGKTPEQIAAAAKKVFIGDGYELMEYSGSELVFEKPGSRMQDLSYGGLLSQEGVWVKAVLKITPRDNGLCWVSCDAYMVKNRDDDFFRDETKVLKAFGREYQRLLNRVKKEAQR